jgi:membrane-associated phospholipid phosphatase
MKKLTVIIFLCALLNAPRASAQWDTALVRHPLKENLVMSGTSGVLIGCGFLAAYNPTVNSWAVSLRDEVMYHDPTKLHFDDQLQYVPMVAPWVLNLCGVKGRHSYNKLLLLEGGSYLLGSGWLNAAKYGFAKKRPDSSTHNSFPSGHTFTAFLGAEIVRREFGKDYPWIAVAAYAVATVVGVMRIYNNRHWAGDVLAGAGLGILSTTLIYWAMD